MVKVYEVIGNAPTRPAVVLPTALKQQQRINSVMRQMAVNDARPRPATETEKMLAMMQMADKKKQANLLYAQRARQQSANADAQLKLRR